MYTATPLFFAFILMLACVTVLVLGRLFYLFILGLVFRISLFFLKRGDAVNEPIVLSMAESRLRRRKGVVAIRDMFVLKAVVAETVA